MIVPPVHEHSEAELWVDAAIRILRRRWMLVGGAIAALFFTGTIAYSAQAFVHWQQASATQEKLIEGLNTEKPPPARNLQSVPALRDAAIYDAEVSAGFLTATGGTLLIMRTAQRRSTVSQRRRAGQCLPCGYDLTANTSGVCPECGSAAIPTTP